MDTGFSLSPQQRDLWEQLVGSSPDSFACSALVAFSSPPEESSLRQALSAAADSCEALRTSLPKPKGLSRPIQVVENHARLDIRVVALTCATTVERLSELRYQLGGQDTISFDLEKGLQGIVKLGTWQGRVEYIHFSFSALVMDRTGLSRFIHRVADALTGEPLARRDNTSAGIEYADFSEWQNQLLKDPENASGRAFWKKTNWTAYLNTRVPIEIPTTGSGSFDVGRIEWRGSKELLLAVERLAVERGWTLPSVTLCAWQAVLAKTVGLSEDPIGVATYFDGRSYEELHDLAGLCGRYLPATRPAQLELAWSEAIPLVAEQLAQAAEHQEFFDWTAAEGSGVYSPGSYFGFIFDYFQKDETTELEKQSISIVDRTQSLGRYKLGLFLEDPSGTALTTLSFDRIRFSRTEIERLLGLFDRALQAFLRDPNRPLSEIPGLSTAEREQYVVAFNREREPACLPQPVTRGFVAIASVTPDRVAARCGEESITYGELERRSCKLAHYLRGLGVGPEVPVMLSLRRSINALVGILGVLRAGGYFVPLDVTYPLERKAFICSEVRAQVILTQEALWGELAHLPGKVVPIDQAWPTIEQAEDGSGLPVIDLDTLAYVIFTSGSTGKPKGVMVSHAGLSHYLDWAGQVYPISGGRGALVHSSLSFDLTLTGLLLPLLHGCEVTLIPEGNELADLCEALQADAQFSLVKMTPSHLAVVLSQVKPQDLAVCALCFVIGGEILRAEKVQQLQQRAPHLRTFNEYGPTETVVGCAIFEARANLALPERVPIGRPIARTRLYLTDRSFVPTPIGATGELLIAGAGVARGYFARPSLTAERFIPEAEGAIVGARAYRSGDACRFLVDGELDCLGRIDGQVKLRGYRIELGEIETTLKQHHLAREALVLVRQLQSGDERDQLVAYVVKETDRAGTGEWASQLRSHLSKKLPAYMVPNFFLAIPEIPLTRNGKVDLQALPQPGEEQFRGGKEFVAPRDEIEQILAGVWQQVLGIARVGIDDNYFSLGGDSIRSIQVVTRSKERGQIFSLEDLFDCPHIRQLAERIRGQRKTNRSSRGIRPFALINPQDRRRLPPGVEDAYPVTDLQGGMIFHNQLVPEASTYHDIFSYHFRLKEEFRSDIFIRAADELALRHAALRTSFDLVNFGAPLQLVYKEPVALIAVTDIRTLGLEQQDEVIRGWLADEKARGFDITKLPLVRIQLHLRAASSFQFTLSFHHSVIDGWSDASLMTELFRHYFVLLKDEKAAIAPPAIHFREFVALEMEAVASAEQQDFWRKEMAGFQVLGLPRPTRPDTSMVGLIVRKVPIDQTTSERLKELALSAMVPVKSVLMAAHFRALRVLAGNNDLLTCAVTTGRPEGVDGDRVLGLFINSLPIRFELRGGTWRDLVVEIFGKEQSLSPFRRFPLGAIKRQQQGKTISETLFYFTHYHVFNQVSEVGEIEMLELLPHEISSFPFVANFWLDPFHSTVNLNVAGDPRRVDEATVERLAGYYERVLQAMAENPDHRYDGQSFLSPAEETQLLWEANRTQLDYAREKDLNELFDRRFALTPDRIAYVGTDTQISFGMLARQTQSLAATLWRQGVGPGARVGICLERTTDLIVALLAVLRCGAAYLILDPALPDKRLEYILLDARVAVVILQPEFQALFPEANLTPVLVEKNLGSHATFPSCVVLPEQVAYVAYTSGSTGQPKGVAVTHRNVVNFFAAMDNRIGDLGEDVTWLAVSHAAFDISVLELLWTLTRGYRVVLDPNREWKDAPSRAVDFSLSYFSSAQEERYADSYRLLLEGAAYADQNGYRAVWTPERHFHRFGGLFPNPAVVSAAVAVRTQRISVRAGSVVLPLHHPIRVAEEWAVVDNLSNGRVGISLASGWHDHDFVLAPDHFVDRRAVLHRQIEVLRRLWRGEKVAFPGVKGEQQVEIFPKPIQTELPIWLTSGGTSQTFELAGQMGFNLLTHVLGQSFDELCEKISLYRAAWKKAGWKGQGVVTLVLHTFLGEDAGQVERLARAPLREYLRDSIDLVSGYRRPERSSSVDTSLTSQDLEAILDGAYDRYVKESSLVGTSRGVLNTIERLSRMGVDEIACLIDFGVEHDEVVTSLRRLTHVKDFSNWISKRVVPDAISELMVREQVTHLQCTPSLAEILLHEPHGTPAIAALDLWLVGGEALPASLRAKIAAQPFRGRLLNMYGPTETTIWSCLSDQTDATKPVAIGAPIANTQVFILDDDLLPVPQGTAGNLCIAGDGVAEGYLYQPSRTAANFLPAIVSAHAGARMYQTGDLARVSLAGELEFLGRRDRQLKLQGNRIELEEIQTVLEACPGVRRAIVSVWRRKENSPPVLVAYLQCAGDPPRSAVLKTQVQSRLPRVMHPAHYVLLEAFPLTPNGKVDYLALPAPSDEAPEERRARRAPSTPTEKTLADMWQAILGAKEIDADGNFFELGGHSLQATQLISRIRTAFNCELRLKELFETPVLEKLAAQIDGLAKDNRGVQGSDIPVISRDGPLPLSYSQRRLWFLDQLVDENTSYNETALIGLEGRLQPSHLEQALRDIIARHEILRASFRTENGEASEYIASEVPFQVKMTDCRAESSEERIALTKQWGIQEANLPFDLSVAPLLRARLLIFGDQQFSLIVTIHHIVCDGWSMGVLIRELANRYEALAHRTAPALATLPVQYVDYAHWHNAWIKSEHLQEQIDYWLKRLDGASFVLDLPHDRVRPAVERFRGAAEMRNLDAKLVSSLAHLGREEDATSFMVMLAAFKALIRRYTGAEDILVGTDIANRRRTEIEGLIGCFTNQLVLRTDLSGNPTLRELIRRVKQTALDAYDHQDVPFDYLVDLIEPARDLSRNPLFQVVFTLHNAPLNSIQLSEVKLQRIKLDSQIARYDFEINVYETPEGRLLLVSNYNTDLFEAETIRSMLRHLENLLVAGTTAPDKPILELSVSDAEETSRLLSVAGPNNPPAQQGIDFVDAFFRQAAARPDAIALAGHDESLSYGQLAFRADQFARRLRQIGVAAEDIVAVSGERTPAFWTLVIGIMRAGAIYLPIDPEYPPSRISQVLSRSHASVVIADRAHLGRVVEAIESLPIGRRPLLYSVEELRRLADEKTNFTVLPRFPENAAYAIFTSGSTGVPKGALITHLGMHNHLLLKVNDLGLTSADVVGQSSHQCFDISIWQGLAALLVGGRVEVLDVDTMRDPELLLTEILRRNITVLELVPSVLRSTLDHSGNGFAAQEVFRNLRWMISTGEALPADVALKWRSLVPDTPLLNAYGPTECSDDVTHALVDVSSGQSRVPIGRPVAEAHLYVLDPYCALAPRGALGELYVGGIVLGRGYLNDPARTADAFIPDVLSGKTGARLYRTGDTVRFMNDGQLIMLGRVDDQVKVRGFRIELGDIEAALRTSEKVHDAVVAIHHNTPEREELVAYVVPASSIAGESETLLKERVGEWESIYDQIYTQSPEPADLQLHTVGWDSTYTGQPIPTVEMQEWVSETVREILDLEPSRILEIGCGTGMLAFRLAARCTEYLGTDLSRPALDFINRQIARKGVGLGNIVTRHQPADNFEGIEKGRYDTVVLNSVVQYFPHLEYLLDVLRKAVEVIRRPGHIFIGDVRDLSLLEAFYTSVLLTNAEAGLSVSALQKRVRNRLLQDEELVISPDFFRSLRTQLPEVTSVRLRLKRGQYHNELTCFRFNVALGIGTEVLPPRTQREIQWRPGLGLEGLRAELKLHGYESVQIKGVPNARTAKPLEQVAQLISAPGELRLEDLPASRTPEGFEPSDFVSLGDTLGYAVELIYAPSTPLSLFDVLYYDRKALPLGFDHPSSMNRTSQVGGGLDRYANNPIRNKFSKHLVPVLREYLENRVPGYMIPAHFLMLDAIPLMANGKIDRKRLPDPSIERPTLENDYSAPRNRKETLLADIWSEVLHLNRVGIHDNFFELGGDSIISIQVVARANQQGLKLIPKDAFKYQTIAELAQAAAKGSGIAAEQGSVTGPVPLTPIQHHFFARSMERRNHYNQAAYVELTKRPDVAALSTAAAMLVRHHDALRARFQESPGSWQQKILSPAEVLDTFVSFDLSTLSPEAQLEAILAYSNILQRGLDLQTGPTFRLAHFARGGKASDRLLLVAHHLCVDAISWQLLLEDLGRGYQQAVEGKTPRLSAKTTSIKQWAERLLDYARAGESQGSARAWPIAVDGEGLPELTPDRSTHNSVDSEKTIRTVFSESMTKVLVDDVTKLHRATVQELLIAALGRVVTTWASLPSVVLDVEGHGREPLFDDVDLSRTVGWFATLYPIRLYSRPGASWAECIQTAKTTLAAVPNHGFDYLVARYLGAGSAAPSGAEIAFNYFGHFDPSSEGLAFRPIFEKPGDLVDPATAREYVLEANAVISGGQLQVQWIYSQRLHPTERVEALADQFRAALEELASEGRNGKSSENVAADLNFAGVDSGAFNSALQEVDFDTTP